ncbi:FecR domain-containing protein [Cohnella sp. GCM10027633]|uniref:FecR domain-containing protein n=1 Tax=unclassified Cohnella TaxID=2636738 RepID=UPI003639CF98
MIRRLKTVVALLLGIVLLAGGLESTAYAQATPSAWVTSVSGVVTVTPAGGSHPIPAFVNMPLRQGDTLTTGDKASVAFRVAKPESDRTLGSDSKAVISKLKSGQFGIKIRKGSMWSSIRGLQNGQTDIVETPGAKLEARGTNFLVTVRADGTLYVGVASGLVTATLADGQLGSSVLLAPTQQLNVDTADLPDRLDSGVGIMDVSSVVSQSDTNILRAFIVSAPAILEENQMFIRQLATSVTSGEQKGVERDGVTSDLSVPNEAMLERVKANIEGLLSNVAAASVRMHPEESAEFLKLIGETNQRIQGTERDIDIREVAPLDLEAGIDPEAAQRKEEELARLSASQREKEADRSTLEQRLTDLLQGALNRIVTQSEAQAKANRTALAELQRQAEQSYVGGLNAEELARYLTDRDKLAASSPSTPGPLQPGTSGPSEVAPAISASGQRSAQGVDVAIKLRGFTGAKAFYAVEFHFVAESGIRGDISQERMLNDSFFSSASSVDAIRNVTAIVDGRPVTETIYAATLYGTTTSAEIADGVIATVPFIADGTGTIRLVYARFVDKAGETLMELTNGAVGLPAAISVGN